MLAGLGGFAGSALRYASSVFLLPLSGACGFPVGTVSVNAAGSFLIGLFLVLIPAGGWQSLAMAGFCGGFTTFSAFSLEALRMLRGGQVASGLGYMAGSVTLCLLCTWAGIVIGKKILA